MMDVDVVGKKQPEETEGKEVVRQVDFGMLWYVP